MGLHHRDTRNVLLCLSTSAASNRSKLEGILRFSHEHASWNIRMLEKIGDAEVVRQAREWPADGLIIGLMRQCDGARFSLPIPVVVMDLPHPCYPPMSFHVVSDAPAIAKTAARFLIPKGFRHFAYIHDPDMTSWSRERYVLFSDEIRKAGFTCEQHPLSAASGGSAFQDWNTEQDQLIAFLKTLPPQTAVFIANDARAQQVLEWCKVAKIPVPGALSILSVDNDERLCESTTPSLASIAPDFPACGYRAAQLLDQAFSSGLSAQQNPIIRCGVPRIVERLSCRPHVKPPDERIQKALAYIRAADGKDVTVQDVADSMRLGRRMAEILFRKQLGETIRVTLQRIRIEHLKTMLERTALPITDICQRSYYQSESHTRFLFKKICGLSMSEYRSKRR